MTRCFLLEPVDGKSGVYRRADTGEQMTLCTAPPGAMWDATWYGGTPAYSGADGRMLIVRLPNGRDWHIDGRASNCDSPCASCGHPYHAHYGTPKAIALSCAQFVESRPHKCWVRHGAPPAITVDKKGVTCGAGAGSIQAGSYHGFLRNGSLT